jgi:hypothetical protein
MFLDLPTDLQEKIFSNLCPKDRIRIGISLPKSTPYVDMKKIRKLEVASRHVLKNVKPILSKNKKLSQNIIEFLASFRNDTYVTDITTGIDMKMNTSSLKLVYDVSDNSVSLEETYDISNQSILEELRYPLAKCSILTLHHLNKNVSTNGLLHNIFSQKGTICSTMFDIINYQNYELFNGILDGQVQIDSQIDYKHIAIEYLSQKHMLKIFCRTPNTLKHVLNVCRVTEETIQQLQNFCEENFMFDSALFLYTYVTNN